MKKEKDIEGFLKSFFNDKPWSEKTLDIIMLSEIKNPMPDSMKNKLFQKLTEIQKEKVIVIEKLNHPEQLNSFGEFLSLVRKRGGFDIDEFSSKIGISVNIVEHLENNDIPIIKTPIKDIKLLIKELGLKLNIACSLIRKSFTLFGYQPDYLSGMARFDIRKSTETKKTHSIRRAFEELHLKKSKQKQNDDFENYITSLKREFEET